MTYPWGDTRRFNSYSGYFTKLFGARVQKVTVNAGFTCPNRDGKISTGGCTFCDNNAFTPSYCTPDKSVAQQIEEGIGFHYNRYRRATKFLAYFQSYSNTYAPVEHLKKIYSQAFTNPDVVGIVVGTRPDCIDEQKLDYFAKIAQEHYVTVEYGIESCYDKTLKSINRGHDFATAQRAIEMTAQRGIHTGAHFILGLPGESEQMLLEQCTMINELPLTTVKFHQLQIFHNTPMAHHYQQHPEEYSFWELGEYIDFFIDILARLKQDIVVERFAGEAPPKYHLGPRWGCTRNEELMQLLERRLEHRDLFQGCKL